MVGTITSINCHPTKKVITYPMSAEVDSNILFVR